MRKVVITIKSGRVISEYSGFQGKACDVLADAIKLDEVTDQEKELKPEYYSEQTATNTVHS